MAQLNEAMQTMECTKVSKYLELLDSARSDQNWVEVPELLRKISKHAPHRECLILTAQTQLRIASLPNEAPFEVGPTDAKIFSEAIPRILAAAAKEKGSHEDVFQAKICIAEIHMTLENLEAAREALPPDLDTMLQESLWPTMTKCTHVGILKGAFARSIALKDDDEAFRASQVMLPYISKSLPLLRSSSAWHGWAKLLLTRQCSLAQILLHKRSFLLMPTLGSSGGYVLDSATFLETFRAWNEFWDDKVTEPLGNQKNDQNDELAQQAVIWFFYHSHLSAFVQALVVKPTFASRLEQAKEYRRVEAINARMMSNLVSFPKANEVTLRVEMWVDNVMLTWRTMISPPWENEDVGSGGRECLSRNVLEILYRAASLSFLSMQIIRSLFEVHAYLCDYDLAINALLQYIELVQKGHVRCEKTSQDEPGLDNLGFSLKVASIGIEFLCECGGRPNIEKANGIAALIECWVSKAKPDTNEIEIPKRLLTDDTALAVGHYAIGLSKSCLARMTYDTLSRTEMQMSAISNFRSALNVSFGEEHNVKTLYQLSVIRAETGELDRALDSVRQAIFKGEKFNKIQPETIEVPYQNAARNQDIQKSALSRAMLVKCWYLLTLLLDTREKYPACLASCEAAFEPYGGRNTLSGNVKSLSSTPNMSLREAKSLLELKMEQLSLTNLVASSEEAVNGSYELFTLFRVLQNDLEVEVKGPEATAMESRPASQAVSMSGAHKGLRASVLGLPKDRRVSRLSAPDNASSSVGSLESVVHSTTGRPIPTTADGKGPLPQISNHHQGFLGRHESKKLKKRPSKKTMKTIRRSHAESSLKSPSDEGQHSSTLHTSSFSADQIGVAMTHDLPSAPSTLATALEPSQLPPTTSTADDVGGCDKSDKPTKPGYPLLQIGLCSLSRAPPPTSLPEPLHPQHLKRRHILATLCRLWLFTSSLYREASLLPDAHASCDAARNAVQEFENSIALNEGSSAENLSRPGYGGLKSCGELWADVLSEEAAVWLAQGEGTSAYDAYETALDNCPDHLGATIGLSNLLLDCRYHSCQEPARARSTLFEYPRRGPKPDLSDLSNTITRLEARDRAIGLLTAITRAGRGWNSVAAWHALGRAYEASAQTDKAVDVFLFVIKLEESAHATIPWSILA